MAASHIKWTQFLCLFLAAICFGGDVILKPETSGGRQVAIILVQGPWFKPDEYVPLAKSVQSASPDLAVWVGVPEYKFDLPVPLDIGSGVERVLKQMQTEGMKANATFLAAHSLSGLDVQSYVAGHPSFKGQILLGSFLQRKYRNTSYPVPTLTLSGELDGVCRVTRIMEEYYHRSRLGLFSAYDVVRFPVVIVRGMNHYQFASDNGTVPPEVTVLDLKPEISFQSAHFQSASVVTAFISTQLGNKTAFTELMKMVKETGDFLQPIINAYEYEGFYEFKPPCNENPHTPACQVGCEWTRYAVKLMGGPKLVAKLNDTDEFHPASEIFPHIHHPQIRNSCAVPLLNCTVNLTSVSQNIYSAVEKIDTGLSYNSASEIRGKMKSRQTIMEAAGMGSVDFNTTDGPSLCKMINENSYNWSMANVGPATLARYITYGVKMVMLDDEIDNNGGIWIFKPMEYKTGKNSTGGETLEVRSLALKTKVTYPIPGFQGMHFCKLLSPARVTEWMYVDSLRKYYHYKS